MKLVLASGAINTTHSTVKLVIFSLAVFCLLLARPCDCRRRRVKHNIASSTTQEDAASAGTFLSNADFDRAQNMSSLLAQESAPMPVALNDPDLYYEGDMMIQESDEEKVAMYMSKKWPGGRIPYIMENDFSEEERAAIARGIMILQERTCIRFVPKKAHDHDYVLMKRGPGCAAHVGRIGGQQWVILGTGCYGVETVTHELMHSVGFIHEQSRPDRDEHVEIVWDNIKSAAKRNFKKHDHDYLADHGFPYDLMSVMHYRQFAFSKNRKPTIVPKRPVPYLRCRGMDCPSEMDIKKINFLYKCDSKKDEYDEERGDADFDNEVAVDDMSSKYKSGEDDDDLGSMECDETDVRCMKKLRAALVARGKGMNLFPDYGYAFGEDDDEDSEPRQHRSRSMRGHLLHRLMLARNKQAFYHDQPLYLAPPHQQVPSNFVSPFADLLRRK